MYYAYITRIKNLRKHPNADRLLIGECFTNSIIVSNGYVDNQLGVYFPSDGQLSVEFADANNLVRKKDENGNNIGGYMDPDKRNVTAIKLRGEKSDGLFLPLKSLESFGDITNLKEGDRIDVFNGHEICRKYVPRTSVRTGRYSEGNKTRNKNKKPNTAPLFTEHADTEQLAYNLGAFQYGDIVEITLKMHGTSQRTAYLPTLVGYKDSYGCKLKNNIRQMMHKILRKKKPFEYIHTGEPIYDWGYVTGTRRVVLDDFDGGFYGSNEFREQHAKFFEGKLNKGETVYYEVVGFTHTGAPIMSSCDNNKTKDKDFIKQYGQTTVFSYGCSPTGKKNLYGYDQDGEFMLETEAPMSDIYVYRMTFKNEDGHEVDYTPDYMRYRCEQMGVKTVPVLDSFMIPSTRKKCTFKNRRLATPGEYVMERAEALCDGPDPIGKNHVREGVVCRVVNRPKFAAWKHKNFSFKVLEGIAKVDAEAPDMEEAQDVVNEET